MRWCSSTPVGSLNWNGQLEAASARHSTDMAANNYWNIPFPHLGTDGTTVRDRAPAAGYNYSTVGENVAAGAGVCINSYCCLVSQPNALQ